MQKIEGRPRGAGVFFVRGPTVEVCIVVLLLIPFCLRVWGLGITTTDDAEWALWAHQAAPHPIADFAIRQGRFWAIGGGTWLTFGLRYTGTVTGGALIIGSFLLFFFMFTRVVATYWSPRTAYATSGIFLALFVLRADRSILTAYPLFLKSAHQRSFGLLPADRGGPCARLRRRPRRLTRPWRSSTA